MDTILGYRRPDNRIGIRNHLLIIPSVICSSTVAECIARNTEGAVCLPNQYGCGQIGKDLEQTIRTLVGLGRNPNVGAVLVVGLGCELVRPENLADQIGSSGKPVEMITIQDAGGREKRDRTGAAKPRQFDP